MEPAPDGLAPLLGFLFPLSKEQSVETSSSPVQALAPKCTIAQAAEHANVSTKTIRRWISQGLVEAERVGPRLIRVNLASLDRLGTPLQYVEGGVA